MEHPSTLQQVLELLLSGLRNLTEDVIGHGRGKDFVPFIAALMFFIFLSNFFGLIFFLQPPTANTSTTFALSLTAFLFYNIVGHPPEGSDRLRRSTSRGRCGGCSRSWSRSRSSRTWRACSRWRCVCSATSSASTPRPGIFLGILPFFVPAMMGLGLLGAIIQTFIFIMLTAVYVSGAVAEEH